MANEKKNRMAGEAISENLQTFVDHHQDVVQPRRSARREKAQEKMGDAYKKDITQYNSKARGAKSFDMADVRYLREQGYSDKEIQAYSSGLSADKLSQGIKLNNKDFAGDHYRGNMAKGAAIGDHDVGSGFNMSDVKYLQNQGFSDEEISKHANQMVTEGGKSHGLAMARYMEKHGQLDYKQGDWKSGSNPPGTDPPGADNPNPAPAPAPEPTPSPEKPAPVAPPTFIGGSQDQTQIVNQDNDINTNVTGNNNTVTNTQDNSVSQYGGYSSAMALKDKYMADVSRFKRPL